MIDLYACYAYDKKLKILEILDFCYEKFGQPINFDPHRTYLIKSKNVLGYEIPNLGQNWKSEFTKELYYGREFFNDDMDHNAKIKNQIRCKFTKNERMIYKLSFVNHGDAMIIRLKFDGLRNQLVT